MYRDLVATINQYFARNPAARGRPGYYGVRVDNVAEDCSEFDLTLTFKSGERYCCAEPGCHTGFQALECWPELREVFGSHGLAAVPPVTIRRLTGVVERGARLRCYLKAGRSDVVSQGYTYEAGPYQERTA